MTASRTASARIASLALLLTLAAASLLAARMLLAELHTAAVRRELDAWATARTAGSAAAWQAAQARLITAAQLFPRHALVPQLEGLLQEWKSLGSGANTPSAEVQLVARRDAVIAYRKAARLRPALASGWANLARQKLLAGEADAEFRHALQLAAELGAQQPAIHLQVLYIAALGWRSFASDTLLMDSVTTHIERGLAEGSNLPAKLSFLRDGGLLQHLCVENSAATVQPLPALREHCP